ncbi:MAG: DUF2721 domain-containing protein [Bacteroidales bacterium]|nr:DUF2721 domain-containing protein [Bacteroidales bacterium]MBN2697811.1 DUF2721 domain-containing protein [Bacteroidales bacterium]
MNAPIVELIQGMLAPGLMISACGLLLLGMNNKYSLVVNRIRLLNEEKRKIFSLGTIHEDESSRLTNIELQISHLIHRISLVRNAVFSYSLAVALFIVSSVLIGITLNSHSTAFNWLIMSFFYAGMLAVFVGIIFAAIEVWKGYRIVKIEVSEVFQKKQSPT